MKRWLVLAGCLYCGLLSAQTVEPAVFTALQQAQAAQAKGDHLRGLQLLEALQPEKGSFAEALVLRNKAYLAWQAGQNQKAANYLEQALKTGQLSAEERQEDGLNLGKLYLQLNQPAKALTALKGQPQNNEVLQLSIQAWQMQGRYDRALPLAERYLATQSSISSQWLQFMVAANANLKQYGKAAQWQQRILKREPDNFAHWNQLSGLQHAAGDSAKAFATLRTAYTKGLEMTAADFRQMLALANAADQPWQGARLLQDLMARGKLQNTRQQQEMLASLYWQARERGKAIELYGKLAEQGNKADHWLILAQLAMQEQNWALSEKALDSAQRAGAPRRRVESWRDWMESSKQVEQMARGGVAMR